MATTEPHHQRHRSTLKKYLQSHSATGKAELASRIKSKSLNSTSTIQASRETIQPSNSSYIKSSSMRLPNISNKTCRDKATVECLPDEILSLIFWKLTVSDLSRASQVCHRWHKVSGDNLLWKNIYARFLGSASKEKERNIAIEDLELGFWRNVCLQRCKQKRDKMFLKKWNHPDPYTGLKDKPELTLSQAGVTFELSFTNSEKLSHTVVHSDVYWSTMSVSVRWYALTVPDIKDIGCVSVYACSPLMFYEPKKPAMDGVIQKSLLLTHKGNIKAALQKQKPVGSDALIHLFELQQGLVVATYKADGEIAFLMCTLHYNNLVSRCFLGGYNRIWSSPSCPCVEDDVDPQHGLHGYTCIFLLRNIRQKLLEAKFTSLHTSKDDLVSGFAEFNPVKKDDKISHVSCIKEISLPWKTTLFKGIVQDVVMLDLTLLDESGQPFWMVTSAVPVEGCTQTNQFEFDPNTYKVIQYQDDIGKLRLEIGKLDDGGQFLSHASISLSVTVINRTYKTSY